MHNSNVLQVAIPFIIKLAIKELAEDDIAFAPSETVLPSRALDKARRDAFVAQFFEGMKGTKN